MRVARRLLLLLAVAGCAAAPSPPAVVRSALPAPPAEVFEQLTASLRAVSEHGVKWLGWGRPARAPVVVLSSYLEDIRSDTTWAVPVAWSETWIAMGLVARLRPAGAPLEATTKDTMLVTLYLPRYHADNFDPQASEAQLRDSLLVGAVHVDRTVPHGVLDCGTGVWLRLRRPEGAGWTADSVLVTVVC